jgi:hypothetical protein
MGAVSTIWKKSSESFIFATYYTKRAYMCAFAKLSDVGKLAEGVGSCCNCKNGILIEHV